MATPNTDEKKLIDRNIRRIGVAFIVGIAMVFLICFHDNDKDNVWDFLSRFGCGMLVGGAAFCAGGILGFLFGIPSMLQRQSGNDPNSPPPPSLKYNDNLMQVSDWLTKIIVGVGLTQLNEISRNLGQLRTTLAPNFGSGAWGGNAAMAVVIYFFLFGFLVIYFWTRTDFTKIMQEVDLDVLQATAAQLKTEQAKAKELEQQKQRFEKIADSAVAESTQETVKQSDLVSDKSEFDALKQRVPDPMKEELDKLREKVKAVLLSKPPGIPEDTQKGRWGSKEENAGKKVSASVEQVKDIYKVTITVANIDNSPLTVPVAIFVDDSFEFPDDLIYVVPNNTGTAQFVITSYEAFTVGVLFSDGTELEKDLNQQTGYPEKFYWKP